MSDTDLVLGRITSDMEIASKIYMQVTDLMGALFELNQGVYVAHVLEVMKKLESVKYHYDNLERIVGEELAKRETEPSKVEFATFDTTTGVEKEFEAFLMQGKATLDVLVRTLKPLLGIDLHSYGEGGQRVLRALQNNLPKGQTEKAEPLKQLVSDAAPWVRQWFGDNRDTITHYRALESTGFVSLPGEGSAVRDIPPKHESGISFHEAAKLLYKNLIQFCQNFIAFSMRVRLPPIFDIELIPEAEREPDYPRTYRLIGRPSEGK